MLDAAAPDLVSRRDRRDDRLTTGLDAS